MSGIVIASEKGAGSVAPNHLITLWKHMLAETFEVDSERNLTKRSPSDEERSASTHYSRTSSELIGHVWTSIKDEGCGIS